jgi:hypothetical protein
LERKQRKAAANPPKEMDARTREHKEWKEKRKQREFESAVKSATEGIIPLAQFSHHAGEETKRERERVRKEREEEEKREKEKRRRESAYSLSLEQKSMAKFVLFEVT